jgi:hypothetical protein
VHIVTARPAEAPRRAASQDPAIEVLSIQRLLTGDNPVSPDVALTAIDAGLGLQGEGDEKPQIRFHKDSGLILVRGRPMDVRLASEIVSRMISDHDRASSETARRRAAEIERKARQGHAAVQLQLAEREIGMIRERLGRATKLVEAGQESTEVLGQVQMELNRAEASHQMAQIDLQRVEDEAKAGLLGGGGGDDRGRGEGPGPGGRDQDPRDARIAALERRIMELEQELGKTKDTGEKKRAR